MSSASPQSDSPPRETGDRVQRTSSRASNDSLASDANIRNFAPVARIMKTALPENAKIAKEAKECMQECVSEFISFITSEGASNNLRPTKLRDRCSNATPASEKCQQEKRKTVNGEDILFAMTSLGFENYAEALKIYLARYREVSCHTLNFLPFSNPLCPLTTTLPLSLSSSSPSTPLSFPFLTPPLVLPQATLILFHLPQKLQKDKII